MLSFFLLVTSQAAAAVPVATGSTAQMGNTLRLGTTSYVVYYSYPSVAQVGTNLTVSLTLHVNGFSGAIDYINYPVLRTLVFVGQDVLAQTVSGPHGDNNTLFPGATWGPVSFTFPLNESSTGIAPGASENVTLSVTLSDTYYASIPNIENEFTESSFPEPPMTASAGSLIIENQVAHTNSTGVTTTQGRPTLAIELGAAAAAVVVLALVVAWRRRA